MTITALCPGITATSMLQGAKASRAQLNTPPNFLVGSAEDVANQGFKACLRGDVICVPGAVNRVTAVAGRATPKWLLRRVSGALVRGMG
jgi:uncharacterized protein